jgi:ABC-2 type transport system ATP-binding protein
MLKLTNVSKVYRVKKGGLFRPRYRFVRALDTVSMEVATGETVAIIGPNGAGKSTLCKIVTGVTKPTEGTAEIDGIDITSNTGAAARSIGFVFGSTLVYHRLTGHDYLKFFATSYGVSNPEKRISALMEELGLGRWLNAYIETYSLGMKVKVSLARALLHDPPFLVLDEFTMGLDPLAAREIRRMITNMKKTVLLTTHNTVEAQTMANRIAFLARGRVAVFDSLAKISKAVESRRRIAARVDKPGPARTTLSSMKEVVMLEAEPGMVEFYVDEANLPQAMKALAEFGVRDVQTVTPSIEDAYAHFTGEELN